MRTLIDDLSFWVRADQGEDAQFEHAAPST